jgi:hypothetical protein
MVVVAIGMGEPKISDSGFGITRKGYHYEGEGVENILATAAPSCSATYSSSTFSSGRAQLQPRGNTDTQVKTILGF